MKKSAVWFLCASVTLLPATGMAAPAPEPAATPEPLTESDTTFSENVSALNGFEITISKLGAKQAKRRKIQEMAEDALKMHTANQKALLALTRKHGLTLHEEMSPDEQQIADTLKTESGAKFERDFLDIEAQATSDALAMFQNEAESASDPDLKAYASTTADTLQAHLNEAMKLGASKPSR